MLRILLATSVAVRGIGGFPSWALFLFILSFLDRASLRAALATDGSLEAMYSADFLFLKALRTMLSHATVWWYVHLSP